jgi:hypothetical protein
VDGFLWIGAQRAPLAEVAVGLADQLIAVLNKETS